MKTSITKKLVFFFLMTVFATIFVSLFIHIKFFRPYYLNYIETQSFSVFEEVESYIGDEDLEQMIAELNFQQHVGIIIADKSFENIIFSHSITQKTQERLRNELQSFIQKYKDDLISSHIYRELDSTMLDADDEELEHMMFIKELSNGYYCILSHSLKNLEGSMVVMNQFHFLAGLCACCFGICTTIFFSKKFTKPILEINNATEKIIRLDFGQKISFQSQDELGQLAKNINELTATLEDYKDALRKEIAFQKLLSQNMSHELKTPISVMQGYLEAINRGVATKKGKVDYYISVVLKECVSMTQLIDQMIQLSKLSSSLVEILEESVFSAVDFADKIQSQHKSLLGQKNITFVQEIEDIILCGNMDLILQAVGNFITNAVKYGDGNKIVMKIEVKDDMQIYSLFNTGSHIPEDELEEIFAVFYMLNQARSRETNSHGLGLSVCRSIAELHKGSTSCDNSENGLTFYLKIPNKKI